MHHCFPAVERVQSTRTECPYPNGQKSPNHCLYISATRINSDIRTRHHSPSRDNIVNDTFQYNECLPVLGITHGALFVYFESDFESMRKLTLLALSKRKGENFGYPAPCIFSMALRGRGFNF